jgi:hypothetical protein
MRSAYCLSRRGTERSSLRETVLDASAMAAKAPVRACLTFALCAESAEIPSSQRNIRAPGAALLAPSGIPTPSRVAARDAPQVLNPGPGISAISTTPRTLRKKTQARPTRQSPTVSPSREFEVRGLHNNDATKAAAPASPERFRSSQYLVSTMFPGQSRSASDTYRFPTSRKPAS